MIRNRPIYHCECCGAVIRHEVFRLPPFCCGHEMVLAGEETLRDDFAHEMEVEPPGLNEPQVAPHHVAQGAEHVSV
jgi:hypothetical protein